MFSLTSLFKRTKNNQIKLGMSENDEMLCCVSLQDNEPQIYWFDKRLEQEQAVRFAQNFAIIRAISYSFIWRKYLFLANQSNQDLLYRQIIQVAKQELPISLNEIYLDFYQSTTENNLAKIILYAIKKSYAEALMVTPQTILDCELYCYVRGYQYQNKITKENIQDRLFSYKNIQFQLKNNQLFIQKKQADKCLELIKDELYLCALGAALWNGKV